MTALIPNSKIITSLCLGEDSEHKVHIGLDRCAGFVPCHLWLVTLSRKEEGKYPAVSLHYVLAPSAEEAIAQCEALPFPDRILLGDEERALLTASAAQVPVMIRGWGRQTF